MFGRNVRNRLPCKLRHTQQTHRDNARQNALQVQNKQKEYYDARRATRPNDIEVGDRVIMKQTRTKERPPQDPEPYRLVEKHGSQLRLERNGRFKNRDTDKVKKFEPIPKVYYKKQIKQGKDDNDYDIGASSDEEEEMNLKTTIQSYSQNRRALETIQEQEGDTLLESRPEEAQHKRSTLERSSPAGSLNRSIASLAS